MTQYLIFHLYGPMQSWGEVAVGEVRNSASHPTRSAVLGLLGAALGLQRSDHEAHGRLDHSLGYGVRVNAPGLPSCDYHTVQPVKRDKNHYGSRRDELARGEINTLVTRRDYLADACYTVALWVKQAAEGTLDLDEIKRAMANPVYPLYLGRKSFPPAWPLIPHVVEAENLKAALAQTPLPKMLERFARQDKVSVYWEGDVEGLDLLATHSRRDGVICRDIPKYYDRHEHHAIVAQAR